MKIRRFSRLKYANKAIQTPAEGDAIINAPAGSVLDNFNKFQSGATTVSYPRDAASRTGGLDKRSVNPFALPVADGNKAIVDISNRVVGAGTNIQNVITAAGAIAVDEANHKILEGFEPAKAIVGIPVATPSTTEVTSQITGLKYIPNNKNTYTIPYGAKTGATTMSEVREDIITAVNTITGGSISFRAERF